MINYTVKLVLRDHAPNASGESAIHIRITIARKTAYIATGHFVNKDLWSEKTESIKGGSNINPDLTNRKNKIIKKIIELQVSGKDFTAKSVKELFNGKDLNNIFDFIDSFCIEVKHKKNDQTIDNYQKHKRKLQKFHGSTSLNFEEITPKFLARYEKHLRDAGAGNNYVHAIWKTLKTFFNAAKKKRLINVYPFDEYENPIYEDPQKDYLTLDELKKWEEFADTTTNEIHKQSAVYFLLGCYSGLRISDWRTFEIKTHVVNDMVKLRAKKNKEWVTIPFNGPLARNIERMRLLPLTIEEPTINEKLKVIAGQLNINKKLSSHCGRKTFAVTMCADQGISSETCATLMGITVNICVAHYYAVTDYKIRKEVLAAWDGL